MTFRPILAAALVLAGMLAAPPGAAQTETAAPEIAAQDVTQGQVVSFVKAMIAAERVRQKYLAKIQAAGTEADRKALIDEADLAGRAAVDAVVGISADEYLAIARAAQENEELAARITARIDELARNQGQLVRPDPAGEAKSE